MKRLWLFLAALAVIAVLFFYSVRPQKRRAGRRVSAGEKAAERKRRREIGELSKQQMAERLARRRGETPPPSPVVEQPVSQPSVQPDKAVCPGGVCPFERKKKR